MLLCCYENLQNNHFAFLVYGQAECIFKAKVSKLIYLFLIMNLFEQKAMVVEPSMLNTCIYAIFEIHKEALVLSFI